MFRLGSTSEILDYVRRKITLDRVNKNLINSITMGVVTYTNDPSQEGRIKVYCPSIDYEETTTEDLPWANYATPFGGVVTNIKVGPNSEVRNGTNAYGWWAIPKVGAIVLVFHLNGDPTQRFWFACHYKPYLHKTLPTSMTELKNWIPKNEEGEEISYKKKILEESGFKDDITRGFFERTVLDKNVYTQTQEGEQGYGKSMNSDVEKELDSQVYSLTTPGGHFITLTDLAEHCRIRIHSTLGKQILLDDTNERIFISTGSGKSYLELDEDGHIHLHAHESLSASAGSDFNFTANNKFKVKADEIHLVADKIKNKSKEYHNLSEKGYITTKEKLEVNGGKHIIASAERIDLNSFEAEKAKDAVNPNIIPRKSFWERPTSTLTRNKHWRP